MAARGNGAAVCAEVIKDAEQALRSGITPEEEHELDLLLGAELDAFSGKWIVLDDDPTGTQTVFGVDVFTDWSVESIREGVLGPGRLFYILTNSRGMTAERSAEVHREIMAHVREVRRETGVPCLVISRSDSTLRGHYPLETALIREAFEGAGERIDGELLIPYFREGGRYTIGDVHYVKTGGSLVPAAETEFARDATFGYTRSDLPGYVEEKTAGKYRAEDVICISLDDLEHLRIDAVRRALEGAEDFAKICVNAICDADLKVLSIALYRAMAAGKRYVFRTAAGFVRAVSGISVRPLLTAEELYGGNAGEAVCGKPGAAGEAFRGKPGADGSGVSGAGRRGGIIVVGSHTEKTTAQLRALLALSGLAEIPVRTSSVLEGEEAFEREISRCAALAERAIKEGKTAVCFTERTVLLLPGDTKEDALLRSVRIGRGVTRLVSSLKTEPAFVIAKGGITSADIAVEALGIRRAKVAGQIRPGVPVWRTGRESRFPGIPYVIFPGNVGTEETLREAAAICMNAEQ